MIQIYFKNPPKKVLELNFLLVLIWDELGG